MNNRDALCIIYRNLVDWSGDLKDVKFNISERDIYAKDGCGTIVVFDDATDTIICAFHDEGFVESYDTDWLEKPYDPGL